jgi:ubiquinone biosynthesis protein
LQQWLTQETSPEKDSAELVRENMEHIRWEIRKANRRLFRAIVGSSFIISASIIYAYVDPTSTTMLGNAPLLTWMLGGLGAFVLIFSWPTRRD